MLNEKQKQIYLKTMERMQVLGASTEKEAIVILSGEINYYKKKIKTMESKIKKLK